MRAEDALGNPRWCLSAVLKKELVQVWRGVEPLRGLCMSRRGRRAVLACAVSIMAGHCGPRVV